MLILCVLLQSFMMKTLIGLLLLIASFSCCCNSGGGDGTTAASVECPGDQGGDELTFTLSK